MINTPGNFVNPVETDETYIGDNKISMPKRKGRALKGAGRGTVGRSAVVGIKDGESIRYSAEVAQASYKLTIGELVPEYVGPIETLSLYGCVSCLLVESALRFRASRGFDVSMVAIVA